MTESFGLSDPGRVRKNNEDFLLVNHSKKLYVVADGMGGAQAGETASKLAAETVLDVLNSRPIPTLKDLEEAFVEANERVRSLAATDLALEGMGTTLVGVLEDGDLLHLASVGDSRIYRYSDGKLESLLEDQTWVNEVGRRLGIDEDALKKHPMRHVLTMAIGVGNPLRVNSRTVPKEAGTLYLLCSDGLHGVVPVELITRILDSNELSLHQRAQALIDAARDHGGPDNITVLILKV
ncbi:MAG: protein phosphatase 2C domain-containing protein [Bryobacter sp.]|nr:protein phosphatase 2C domain-containing protein [Bryobacter sp.]